MEHQDYAKSMIKELDDKRLPKAMKFSSLACKIGLIWEKHNKNMEHGTLETWNQKCRNDNTSFFFVLGNPGLTLHDNYAKLPNLSYKKHYSCYNCLNAV